MPQLAACLEEGNDNMSYSELIDVTVDTSELDSALDDIRSQIADIVNEQDAGVTEDSVRDIFRDLAHSEGEDFVRDTISNEGYITEDEVARQIRDALDGYEPDLPEGLDDDGVREIVGEQFGALDGRIDRIAHSLEQRIESLTQQVIAQDSAIDALQAKLADMTQDVISLREDARRATTFFDLLRHAVEVLVKR